MTETKTPVEKWLEALRSGEYTQTKGVLHQTQQSGENPHPNGYCCLGVACDLYAKEFDDLKIEEIDGLVLYDDKESILPIKVRQWLGLSDHIGSVVDPLNTEGLNKRTYSLTAANDNGVDFNQIADIIESRPSGLFREEF